MLKNLDILVFDMQDIGVRYYTYLSTLTNILEAASKNGIPVLVLDRVNPLERDVEGFILEEEFKSYVGMHPIPVRHGMTLGELAMMLNGEGWLLDGAKVNLKVIKYDGEPNQTDSKEAFNPPPSPNMQDLETAWLYQGLCLLEGTNLSEGRGTAFPFKLFGAPWLDSKALADKLQQYNSTGDKYEITSFTPQSIPAAKYPKYEGEECKGIRIITLNNPLIWTMHLLQIVHDQHPEQFRFLESNFIDKLYGSDKLRLSIQKERNVTLLFEQLKLDKEEFFVKRENYLIY